MQNYFTRILEENLKAIIKPQYVDHIPRAVKGTVVDLLTGKSELSNKDQVIDSLGGYMKFHRIQKICLADDPILDLREVMTRQVEQLSGGELQRFAIAIVCVQRSDIYMFDEPSSYLDVKQRLNAARAIRSLILPQT